MTKTRVALKASLHAVPVLALTAFALFASGCARFNIDSSDTMPMAGAAIRGRVHGGQSPISGSNIQLTTLGSTGYGSKGTQLLTTTVTSAADGSFSITGDYTCPTASTPVVLVADGGDPGIGSNNPAIDLAAPLGPCGSLTSGTFVDINEVTTAAVAVAFAPFATVGVGNLRVGTSSTNGVGLVNASNTAVSLVNFSTGIATASTTLTGAGGIVTATPESAKLNTIANILSACVNSNGSGTSPCATLFADVAPTGSPAPTGTAQAAVYMAQNPTSNNANGSANNLAALYGLQTGTSPFVGVSTQPTDWTIGIQYTDSSATTLLQPQNIAADASGNIWVLSSASGAKGNLVELSPTGTPLVNALNTATAGTGINTATPQNLAIDTNGNVWITTSGGSGYVFDYNPSSGTANSYATGGSAYGLAIDGNNNVFAGQTSSSANFQLYEFPGGNIAEQIQYPIASSTPGTAGTAGTNSFVLPQYMAFDTSGNLWMTNGSGTPSSGSVNQAVQLSNINDAACIGPVTYPCALSTSPSLNTYTAYSQGSITAPWGVASGGTFTLWLANLGNSGLTDLSLSGATVNSGIKFGTAASLTSPHNLAVDGAGNLWVSNYNVSPGSVSEFSSSGSILSPTAPTVGFQHTGLAYGQGITIDASGNVWVADNVAGGANSNTVFEIVGAAAPTVTPIALALKNNAVGQEP